MFTKSDRSEMEKEICHLLWKDWDGFFLSLKTIAKGETEREIIPEDLEDWWKKLHNLLDSCPFDLPKDD